jgi:RNA polymerase sigma factor (sigma-70 family)
LAKDIARVERLLNDSAGRVAGVIEQEQIRLRNFIRRRVPDARDVEDILQDVFAELVEANRRLMPIDHVGAWLFRVARNRITDLFRRKTPARFSDLANGDDEAFEDRLASADAGPEALYDRRLLIDALAAAVAELPKDQRDVFVAHEVDGRSFKELAAETGVGINTLLSRKHDAVRRLRKRLRRVYDELSRK